MRRFACTDCRHEWEVPFGTGKSGRDMACPACGGLNIHRRGGGPHGKCVRGAGGGEVGRRAGKGFGPQSGN